MRGNLLVGVATVLGLSLLATNVLAQAHQRLAHSQRIQAAQSALNVLGYDAGPADGFAGPLTRDAIVAYRTDNGLGGDNEVNNELLQSLMDAVTPVIEERLGMSLEAYWDIDLSGLSEPEMQDLADLYGVPPFEMCGETSPFRFYIEGNVMRDVRYGFPFVLEIEDDAILPLAVPGGEVEGEFTRYEVVDADTLRRAIEGTVELWRRCPGQDIPETSGEPEQDEPKDDGDDG